MTILDRLYDNKMSYNISQGGRTPPQCFPLRYLLFVTSIIFFFLFFSFPSLLFRLLEIRSTKSTISSTHTHFLLHSQLWLNHLLAPNPSLRSLKSPPSQHLWLCFVESFCSTRNSGSGLQKYQIVVVLYPNASLKWVFFVDTHNVHHGPHQPALLTAFPIAFSTFEDLF
jgi:hypothetical protein